MIYNVFNNACAEGLRKFYLRAKEHPFMVGWFFVLLLAGEWMIIQVISLSALLKLNTIVSFSYRDVLIFGFFLFTGIAYSTALNHFVKERKLVWYFSQPVELWKVFAGTWLLTFWLIEGVIAIGLSTMVGMVLLLQAPVSIPFDFGWKLVLVGALGSFAGFAGGIFVFLKPMRRKIGYLYLFSMVYPGVWYALEHPLLFVPVFGYVCLLLYLAYRAGLEGWNNGIVLERVPKKTQIRIPVCLKGQGIKKLAHAEWLYIVRNSEHVSIPLVVVFAFFGQMLALRVLPAETLTGATGKYTYAAVAGTALFVASALLSVISALSVVGKDGRAYWVLKTVPLSGEKIMLAKTYWVLLTCLVALPLVLLALPLYMFRKIPLILFVVASGISSAFISTAAGTWGAARYPDFSAWHRGSTDIITTYNVLILALLLNVVFLGIPLQIYFHDKVLGILAAIFSADMGALAYLVACRVGGREYEKIEK
ncbi:MAG: hypothetical protein N3F63_01210 [Thermoplasmata archaeon]|nr:hypothetical protein [Thermoplasmata archaeon]